MKPEEVKVLGLQRRSNGYWSVDGRTPVFMRVPTRILTVLKAQAAANGEKYQQVINELLLKSLPEEERKKIVEEALAWEKENWDFE